MRRPPRPSLLLLLSAACAPPPGPAEPPPAIAPLERRIAADLTWRPGDSQPIPRDDLARLGPPPPDGASVRPMQLATELRNRCPAPATFAIGPATAAPDDQSPTTTLAPGAAIQTGLTADEWVFLRAHDGRWPKAQAPGGWLVFTGESACDTITAVPR